MNQSYIWIKDANIIDIRSDKISFHKVKKYNIVYKVIESLKMKNLGRKLKEEELRPRNPSVIKWITTIFSNMEKIEQIQDIVENIINEFRAHLKTRSKEIGKYIVGLLTLDNKIVIFHCRKLESVAYVENNILGVDRLLDPQNVYRAIIIEKEDETRYYYFFEYNYKLSHALAEMFGISHEDIGFETLGNISFILDIEDVAFKLLLPLNDIEEVNNLFRSGDLTINGEIKLGNIIAKITGVKISKEVLSFQEFYERYIIWKRNLNRFKKKFNEIIHSKNKDLLAYFSNSNNTYRYIENENIVYEDTSNGVKEILRKEHDRFLLLFSTKKYPGVKPNDSIIRRIKNAIFNKTILEIHHVGMEFSDIPIIVGGLYIFNKLPRFENSTMNILDLINSIIEEQMNCNDKKVRLFLQLLTVNIMYEYLFKETHFEIILFLIEDNLRKELNLSFRNVNRIGDHENRFIEFKSAADYMKYKNPSKFAKEELISTLKSKGKPLVLIYGVEDNREIQPIVYLKSDMLNTIERVVKEEANLVIKCYDLSVNDGRVLVVLYF